MRLDAAWPRAPASAREAEYCRIRWIGVLAFLWERDYKQVVERPAKERCMNAAAEKMQL